MSNLFTIKKYFFYVLLILTLCLEVVSIICFLDKDINVTSFLLILSSNLFIMVTAILNIKKLKK